MGKTYNFDAINIKLPRESIYRRMGYRKDTVNILPERLKEFETYIEEAFSLLNIKGLARRMDVLSRDSLEVVLESDVIFKSHLLASLVKNCSQVVFMAATAGEQIISAIESLEDCNLAKAVVYDSVASEAVDVSLGWIESFLEQELKRESLSIVRRRISCGYGDFDIKYQRVIYDILDMGSIGVKINSHLMLMPEKSVTAVTGVVRVE